MLRRRRIDGAQESDTGGLGGAHITHAFAIRRFECNPRSAAARAHSVQVGLS
jgi:hypothetical protein